MTEVKLHITAKQERLCREWCRRWYPREAFGFLLGTLTGDVVCVDQVWLPSLEQAEANFKKDRVFVDPEWAHDIEEECDGLMRIVGDFHSHPYLEGETRAAPVQSDFDLDNAGMHAIFGICNVWPRADGKLATRLRWWGPSIKVRVKKDGDVGLH